MPLVELLFFPECPHVEAARIQLRRAFEAAGVPPLWTEHDVTRPGASVEHRGYGSPTVLVEGHDVMGTPPGDGAACRLYLGTEVPGAPPLQALVRALTGHRPASPWPEK